MRGPKLDTRVAARRWVPGVLLALLLGACGGGGSGNSPTAPGELTLDQVESQSFTLVNQARTSGGLGSLRFDEQIAAMARAHSRAMRDQGFFGHRDPAGNGLRARLRVAGVSYSSAAENLAQVSHPTDPASLAHRELMGSGEHRNNILGPGFQRVGVGVARRGDVFWITQVFVSD